MKQSMRFIELASGNHFGIAKYNKRHSTGALVYLREATGLFIPEPHCRQYFEFDIFHSPFI
jgi:hypothetical protein